MTDDVPRAEDEEVDLDDALPLELELDPRRTAVPVLDAVDDAVRDVAEPALDEPDELDELDDPAEPELDPELPVLRPLA